MNEKNLVAIGALVPQETAEIIKSKCTDNPAYFSRLVGEYVIRGIEAERQERKKDKDNGNFSF